MIFLAINIFLQFRVSSMVDIGSKNQKYQTKCAFIVYTYKNSTQKTKIIINNYYYLYHYCKSKSSFLYKNKTKQNILHQLSKSLFKREFHLILHHFRPSIWWKKSNSNRFSTQWAKTSEKVWKTSWQNVWNSKLFEEILCTALKQ